MLDFLKKIYEQYEFETIENEHNILFSSKENQEYYLTVEYTENEFKRFYDSEKSVNLISSFNKLKRSKSDIEKNTSLILCLKLSNIQEITTELRNIIFSIEEDEYYFRKYVIIYTENSIKNIDYNIDIKKQLHDIVKKEDMMKEYQKNCYFNEEFFLAMQLFVKLPFLVYEGDDKKFTSIEEKLENAIKIKGLEHTYNKVINYKEELRDDKSEYISKLTEAFLYEEKENSILNDFFDFFEVIE